jgi:hypothetical protein
VKFITRFKIQIRNSNEKKMNQKGKKKKKEKKKAMRLGRHCSFSAHFIHPPRGPITPTPARAVTLPGPSLTSGAQSSSSSPTYSTARRRPNLNRNRRMTRIPLLLPWPCGCSATDGQAR